MQNTIRLVALWGAALLVGSCATFQPKPLDPQKTASSFEARTLHDDGLKAFLEKNFHRSITPWPPKIWDFQLMTLAAFYYHPDLDVARTQWQVTEAEIITAGGRPNPSVSFLPQYVSNAASGISPWLLDFAFDIPIETAGKRGYRIVHAQHLSDVARLKIAEAGWKVRHRLRTRLLELYASHQREALLQKQLTAQEDIVKMLEQRLAAGQISQPEVTQARLMLGQVRLSLLETQRQSSEARVWLADALGLPVKALEGVTLSYDVAERIPQIGDISSKDIRHRALFNRIDILGLLAEYAASQAALQLETAKQYPDIHLGPGYFFDQGQNVWGLGFSASLPILNRNEGPIAEAEARHKEAAARFIALQAEVIGELDRTLVGALAALKKLDTADALLSDQKKQSQTVQARFHAGAVDRLALLSAQFELFSAEVARLDSLVKAQEALGALEDATQRPLDAQSALFAVPEQNPRERESQGK